VIARREQTDADFRRARELVLSTGALQATLDLAQDYADRAKRTLRGFPGGEWRSALEGLADFAVTRAA
jgi:octaprenyl-diphosphate synthase